MAKYLIRPSLKQAHLRIQVNMCVEKKMDQLVSQIFSQRCKSGEHKNQRAKSQAVYSMQIGNRKERVD